MLLPLDSCGGFGCDVVNYSVDVTDLVDDATRDFLEDVVWDAAPVGGHAVYAGDCAKGDGVIVGALVPHHAYAAHACEHGEGQPSAESRMPTTRSFSVEFCPS